MASASTLRRTAIARILDGVWLDGVAIEFQLTREAKDVPAHVAALVKKRGLDPASCRSARRLRSARADGGGRISARAVERDRAAVRDDDARRSPIEGFRGPFAVADGRVIHNAGGSEAQELAFALVGRGRLSARAGSGRHALDAARRMIFFRLSRRRRPVHDHGEVSRACGNCGRASRKPAALRRSRPSSRPRPRGA